MNNRAKKNFKFFVFLIILCLLAFGGAMLLKNNNGSLNDFLDSFSNNSFKDNYNGVYTYSDDLNGSKTLFSGCTLSKIDNHIVIINDKYYVYRSSCIGTFAIAEGDVKKLNIGVNEERETYYIKYNDQVYYKNHAVTSLNLGNNLKEYNDKYRLSDYQLLFREAQRPNEYFNLPLNEIDNSSSDLSMEFLHVKDESFTINVKNDDYATLYSYTFKDFNSMPEFYPYGAYLVVIEKEENEQKYSNNFKVIGESGIIYDLNDKFPIIVDDIRLDNNKSVYAAFDPKDRDFRILISDSKQMCFEKGNQNEISYYEFMIDYNYSTREFEKPEFVKRGFKSDSCVYINEILGGEV